MIKYLRCVCLRKTTSCPVEQSATLQAGEKPKVQNTHTHIRLQFSLYVWSTTFTWAGFGVFEDLIDKFTLTRISNDPPLPDAFTRNGWRRHSEGDRLPGHRKQSVQPSSLPEQPSEGPRDVCRKHWRRNWQLSGNNSSENPLPNHPMLSYVLKEYISLLLLNLNSLYFTICQIFP